MILNEASFNPLFGIMQQQEFKADVLIVDDEETNLRVLEAIVKRCGFDAVSTLEPGRALEVCAGRERPFKLAILDVKMPATSGVEVAVEMSRRHPSTRFLFVSGTPFQRWTPQDREGLRELGRACCMLPKPFLAQSLQECIRCLLGGHSQMPECTKHGVPVAAPTL